ncbi:MAG: fluoride efflux transporter CrcB [Pirellulales bacterium]|nr:fluoride efflux transporter CrcB [Pirellulales bacterium]
MVHAFAIAIGGAAGALSRHGVNKFCARVLGSKFAFGTLVVNVLGCFLLGFFYALRQTESTPWSDSTDLGLRTGFLGALTTFSTFGLDATLHFQAAEHSLGIVYIACNLVLGLAAVYAGMLAGRWFGG